MKENQSFFTLPTLADRTLALQKNYKHNET